MEIIIKVNKAQRLAYIPKSLASLGRNLTIIPNTCAAVIIAENAGLEDALKSLDIIRQDLEHRLEMIREGAP